MVARVRLPGMVTHDRVGRRPEAPPRVSEQDPIYPPRPEVGVRIAVARALEGVEGVRFGPVVVACDEVGIHEAAPYEVAVRGGSWAAVEVPRDDDRYPSSVTIQELCHPAEDKPAALDAGHLAHVVQVRVQVQEGPARGFEIHPFGGADDPRSPAGGVPLRRVAKPETARVEQT